MTAWRERRAPGGKTSRTIPIVAADPAIVAPMSRAGSSGATTIMPMSRRM